MKILTVDELNVWLQKHPKWSFDDPEIVFEHKFKDFLQALAFIVKVGIVAEKHNHHPSISNAYNAIRISMATHDAGNKITDRDTSFAEEMEKLL